MNDNRIRDVVIVGGGTAGWMAAAAFAKVIGTQTHKITLVESEDIGTVGVGEATIPAILLFNKLLDIDEDEFVRETNATFKLGIEFVDWRRLGHTYFHNFGLVGADIKNGAPFIHYWLRSLRSGGDPDWLRYNSETEAARQGKFGRSTPRPGVQLPSINYAFQFDAATYAAYLRRYSERRGVVRREGKVTNVRQNPETGFIEAVELADGGSIGGDLFIDCSGFRGLLIEGVLEAGFDDWSHWLPNNRAAAVPCERIEDPTPFTRATARESGWQWRIPLQHRTGNGYVFSDAYISEDEAVRLLLDRLDAKALADPKVLRFTAGVRRSSWVKNCVAVGLSSGFLEPLESTSIYLIQVAILKLMDLFPDRDFNPFIVARFNEEMDHLYETIRDFIIAHYKITERDDTPYWNYCRTMSIPDSLTARLELFKARGEALPGMGELFSETSWFAILYGQGLEPESYHPLADAMSEDDLNLTLAKIRTAIRRRVDELPSHEAFLQRCCGARSPSAVA
jgi:tryptophan 7-halogenase